SPAGNNPTVQIRFVSCPRGKRLSSLLLANQFLEPVVSDQLGDCLRSAFRQRGLLVCVDAQRMSGLECCCLGSETLDRPDDGFSLLATSVRSGLPPSKYPNIWATLPLFALHASLLIPCSP